MFAKTIVLSDSFLDMPLSARCLYFTLGMVADDDGFVNNPKSIMRQCGAQEDDMKILFSKKFLLAFESGVIVIKHWRINNYLQKDRYNETKYLEEKAELSVEKNGTYSKKGEMYTQDMYTQVRLGKDSIGNIEDSNVSFCSEAKQVCSEPPIVEVVLNDGSMHSIYQNDVDAYRSYYPAIDVVAELRKAAAWCYSNPNNRKTKRGVSRFINGWLSRAQDKAPKVVDVGEKEWF